LDEGNHPNILVIFILVNYIGVLQPTNVILQWTLKHAFKVQFNSWTTAVIKQQIEDGQNPQIDFKISNLKPHICGFTHAQ
jgi:hypothetical protein